MTNRIIITAIAALCIMSCAKVSTEGIVEEPANQAEYISLRIMNEGQQMTKSYYYEDQSYWTYAWEDKDEFNYFTYSRTDLLGSGNAKITKGKMDTFVNILASDLEVGNTIYSYLKQQNVFTEAVENNDPENIKMVIPVNQITTLNPEQFRDLIDNRIECKSASVNPESAEGDAGTLNLGNVSIPDVTLSFSIGCFKSALNYKAELIGNKGKVSGFEVDKDGNATVKVSFEKYETSAYTQVTSFKVFAEEYPESYALFTVTATRKDNKGTNKSGRVSYYSATVECTNAVSYDETQGETKPYPVRDAMPCVSKGKFITTGLREHPEDIANAMTMYMLGSAAEFKIYSSTGKYQGETIEKVILTTTNEPCAGYCYYNITSENLEITGCDQNTITSDVSACNYHVPVEKGSEESIYLVIAPGTYDMSLDVITKSSDGKKWNYHFTTTDKTFVRANRKPFAVNLESAAASRSAL